MGSPLKVLRPPAGLTFHSVAVALRDFVEQTGKTQRQVAKRMGVSHATISKMLHGKQLNVENVNALLLACEKSWQDLLEAVGVEPSPAWHDAQEVIGLIAELRRENEKLRARLRGK